MAKPEDKRHIPNNPAMSFPTPPLRLRLRLACLAAFLPALLPAQTTWKGRDGDWGDPQNWSKNAVPSLTAVAPAKKTPAKPAPAKPSAPSSAAPAAPAAPVSPVPPPPVTAATPNAIVLGGGTGVWDASVLGDFAVEVPVLITKKAAWKQTGGVSWIFIRNNGSLTVADGRFDGGTSNNLIVGGDVPGHVLVTGPEAVLAMPSGEIKLRRNATFIVRDGNVSATLVSFDDPAAGTHGVLTLAGGTLTLSSNAYGGIYGGGEHHYVNFPPGSKAAIILPAIEPDGVYEQLEKGGIRFNHRIDVNAFKVELREGAGSRVTLDPAAKP